MFSRTSLMFSKKMINKPKGFDILYDAWIIDRLNNGESAPIDIVPGLWNSIDIVQTIFCPWRRPTQDHQNKISFQIPRKVTVANFDTASGIWKLQWWRPTQDQSPKLKRKIWLFSYPRPLYASICFNLTKFPQTIFVNSWANSNARQKQDSSKCENVRRIRKKV